MGFFARSGAVAFMAVTASVTWQFGYIFYPHATGKKSNCQEETYNENRNQHKNPGDWLKATVA